MLSKSLLCASLLFLAPFANAGTFTPPSTKCTTVAGASPGNHRHSRTYTRVGSCTNTVPKSRTTSTTITTTPTSTSTVYTTSISTADTSTETATNTVISTQIVNSTTTETAVSTSSVGTTTTSTTYLVPPNSQATKRAVLPLLPELEARQQSANSVTRTTPSPGVVCLINRCTRTRVTTTSTITSVAPETTIESTSTIDSTVTPNASTTVDSTSVITSTSTITTTSTSVYTSTSTTTVVYTATPTFYIESNGANPNIADGTELTNVPDSTNGEGTGNYGGQGTLFMLDPSSGMVYSNSQSYGPEYLNTVAGASYSQTYFDTEFLIEDLGTSPGGALPAICTINNQTLALQCNNGASSSGNNQFATLGNGALYLNKNNGGRGYYQDSPVVDIVNQQ